MSSGCFRRTRAVGMSPCIAFSIMRRSFGVWSNFSSTAWNTGSHFGLSFPVLDKYRSGDRLVRKWDFSYQRMTTTVQQVCCLRSLEFDYLVKRTLLHKIFRIVLEKFPPVWFKISLGLSWWSSFVKYIYNSKFLNLNRPFFPSLVCLRLHSAIRPVRRPWSPVTYDFMLGNLIEFHYLYKLFIVINNSLNLEFKVK